MTFRNQGNGKPQDYKAEEHEPQNWDDGNARGDYEHRQNAPQPGMTARPASSGGQGGEIPAPRRHPPSPVAQPASVTIASDAPAAHLESQRGSRNKAQSHFGKAPQQALADDQPLRREISERLTWSDEVDASAIKVQVQGQLVILTGEVANPWQKSTAEAEVLAIPGVQAVDNRLAIANQQQSS